LRFAKVEPSEERRSATRITLDFVDALLLPPTRQPNGTEKIALQSDQGTIWSGRWAPVAQTVARLWADDLGYIVIIRSKRSSNPRPEPVRQPYSGFYCNLDLERNAELRILLLWKVHEYGNSASRRQ